MNWALWIGLSIAFVSSGGSDSQVSDVSVDETYDLLKRLELDRFQIAFLERELELDQRGARSDRLATELASLLVRQGASGKAPESDTASISRLSQLLEQHPELRSPSIRAAVAYAEFVRVERSCQSAFDRPQPQTAALAQRIIRDLADRLAEQRRELASESFPPVGELSSGEMESDSGLEQERAERVALIKQIQFYLAWLRYYDGLLADSQNQKLDMWQLANAEFRAILDIPADQKLSEMKLDPADFRLALVARAVLGLAVSEQSLGRLKESEQCFALLQNPGVPDSLRVSVPSWRLRGFVYADQLAAAADWLSSVRHSIVDAPSAGSLAQIGQCVVARRDLSKASLSDQLALLGEIVVQLVESDRSPLADALIQSTPEILDAIEDSFHKNWILSRRLFQTAEQGRRSEDFLAAIRAASAALGDTEVSQSPRLGAELRSIIAWSRLRTGQYVQAAREFRRIALLTRSLDPDASARAGWTGIQALLQAPDAKTKLSIEIFASLDEFERLHPNSSQAELSRFERLRLRALWLNDPAATRQLADFAPTDPHYSAAQLALCQVRFNEFSEALAADVANADERFAALENFAASTADSSTAVSDSVLARIRIRVADAAMEFHPPNLDSADRWLNLARPFVEPLAANDPAVSIFHATRLKWAIASQNEPVADESARWLADNGPTRESRLMGMISAADLLDRKVGASPGDRELLERAYQGYRRITDELGVTAQELRRSGNALAGLSRLASLEVQTDRRRDADRHYTELLLAAPDDLNLLQQSARNKIELEEYAAALELWRRIACGTAAGPDWLEAKYFVIVCLAKSSPPEAAEVLDQALNLAGELPEDWREPFERLRDQLQTDAKR